MRHMRRTRTDRGLTLVELMAVVVVLGVLAAIAGAGFARYIRRSKTVEAHQNLSRLYIGTALYYDRLRDAHDPIPTHALNWTPATPARPFRYAVNVAQWADDPRWAACGFTIDSAHYYRYATTIDASGISVFAEGDLDGDNLTSLWEIRGTRTTFGDVQQQPLTVQREFE